jgi:glycosyltransferase involved in cell wall biosynthesis
MSTQKLISDVTVIIATRNRRDALLVTIIRCLEIGILENQIVVTDDASTDGTPEAISEMHPSVTIIRNLVPRGVLKNRNEMMQNASTKFILSLDDDANLLSQQDLLDALCILSSKEEFGFFCFIPFEQLAPPKNLDLPAEIYVGRSLFEGGHIMKRSILPVVMGYREELIFYGEGSDLAIRAFMKGIYVVKKRI